MNFFKSIKFRLTLWYLLVMFVLLLVFGGVAYFMLSQNLYRNLDDSLKRRVTELTTTLSFEEGRAVFAGQPNEVLLIYSSGGNPLQRFGPRIDFESISGLVEQTLSDSGQELFLTTFTSDGQEVRLYAVPFATGFRTRVVIVAGQITGEIKYVLATSRYIMGVSGIGVIILAGIGGFFLASRALKPVDRITRTAREIEESDLSRRIDVQGEDELGRLAATLNQMIERIDAAFSRQRQFTADASHELRTPLAIIEAESTLALSKERTGAEYRKSLELVSQEAAYMSALINKLLFLARSDAGKEPLELREVNLKELLTELSQDVEVLAREKGLDFSAGTVEDITVKGDRVRLRQLFLNLFENAVKYTPGGGSISLSLLRKDGMAAAAISDTGTGIAPEHLPHIFERFYRVDKARSRAEGGVGLGLAIARYIAEAHGGRIDVESQVGKGSTFYVWLPVGE